MKGFQHMLAASAVALGMAMGAPSASAEIQSDSFKVVGTWHNLPPYYMFEKPFWEEQVELRLAEIQARHKTGTAQMFTCRFDPFQSCKQFRHGAPHSRRSSIGELVGLKMLRR